jgi:hypothetical protein
MAGITKVKTIEQLIRQILPLAVRDFRTLVTSLSQTEGLERLELLNALVLVGPAYVPLEAESEGLAVAESVEIREEIEALRLISEIYFSFNEGSSIDIEVENLIFPATQISPVPPRKVPMFLQASTDARKCHFGRLICFLSDAPILNRDIFRSAGAQRSIAFALHVMAERRLNCGAWRGASRLVDDQIARLTFSHALGIAWRNALVSDETVSSVINAFVEPKR